MARLATKILWASRVVTDVAAAIFWVVAAAALVVLLIHLLGLGHAAAPQGPFFRVAEGLR
jgi:hypothetical protein